MVNNSGQATHGETISKSLLTHSKPEALLWKVNSIGVLALLATLPFSMIPFTVAFLFPRPTVSQTFYFEISVISLAIIIAALHIIFGVRVKALGHPLCFPALLFGFFILLSCLFARSPLHSLRESLFPLSCIIFFLLVANAQLTVRDLSKIIWILLGVGALLALYGILQYYGIDIQLATSRGELGYEEQRKIGKFAVLSLAGHPNFLSTYLAGILLMSVPVLFFKSPGAPRIIGTIALCIVAYCIFLSGVRGAWLGLFVVGLVLGLGGILRGPSAKRIRVLLACLGIAFIILMILFSVPNPIITPRYNVFERIKDKQALLSRAYGYHLASNMLKQHMLAGTGYRSFTDTFWDVVSEFQRDPENAIYQDILNFLQGTPPGYIHNEYLEIGTGMGLGGIASFFLILAVFFTWNSRRLKEISVQRPAVLYAFLAGGVMFYVIDSLPSFPLDLPLSGSLFWFLLAVGMPPMHAKSVSLAEKQPRGIGARGLCFAIALTLTALVFFYAVCFIVIPPISRAIGKSYYESVESSHAKTQASLEQKIRENPANLKAYYDLLQIYIAQKDKEAADSLFKQFVEHIYHEERYGYWIAHFFLDYTLFTLGKEKPYDAHMGLALAFDYGVTAEEMLEQVWTHPDYKFSRPVQSAVLSFVFSEGYEQIAQAARTNLIENGIFLPTDLPAQVLFQSRRAEQTATEYRRAKDALTRIATAADWKAIEGIGKNGHLYSKGILELPLRKTIPAGSSLWIWMRGTPVMEVYPLVEIKAGNQASLLYVRGENSAPYKVELQQAVPPGEALSIRFLNDTAFPELQEDRNLTCGDVLLAPAPR
jgi:ABC-type multidrug transport system fused ATPase/permease subunit